MGLYGFKAKTNKGKIKSGTIEAANEQYALDTLAQNQLTPLELEEIDEHDVVLLQNVRISPRQKIIFYEQLATLLNSAIAIPAALKIIAQQTPQKKFASLILRLEQDTSLNKTFHQAISQFPNQFSKIERALIKAGETSGRLDIILNQIAKDLERDNEIKSKFKAALLYPSFILMIFIIIGFIFLWFIIPTLAEVFSQSKTSLPITTKLLLSLSNTVHQNPSLPILLIIILITIIYSTSKIKSLSKIKDQIKVYTPIFGALYRRIYIARFSRGLASLIAAGLSLSDSLNLISQTIGNSIYGKEILNMATQVESGTNLTNTIEQSPLFNKVAVQMIKIGETSGQLEKMLNKVADFFEKDAQAATRTLTSLIEPILILIIGIIIGIFAVSVIIPIYSGLYNSI